MRIGVLGTGAVGRTLATKCVSLGHDVMMGSRTADNNAASDWAASQGDHGHHGTFASAAEHGELLINATSGMASLAALESAGSAALGHKVLIDVANALDFSEGMPPKLAIVNTTSLGEEIQKAFPQVKVVKTLNTMNCDLMVRPGQLNGSHNVFLCGNDERAKGQVIDLLKAFGWTPSDILDLGDITASRGLEMILPLWLRLMARQGTPAFNFKIVR